MTHPVVRAAHRAESFFDGFSERVYHGPEGHIFYRIAGDGPPLLLLHGYPQTSAMWHAIAPRLAEDYQVICPDLRGYGRSHKPPVVADHATYSKRAMADDMVALMAGLGHDRFLLGAHDRGARVAHRLTADQPEKVIAFSVLDIAPTREMYRDATSRFAHAYWHWYWLTIAAPFPETLIGADPDFYLLQKCGGMGNKSMDHFVAQALDEYLTCFRDPAAIKGACEDYRAAATIDIAHDDAETAKVEVPLLALWGADGVIAENFDCLGLWRERVAQVTGRSLPGGHYLAEQSPDAVLEEWLPFFAAAMAQE